MYDLHEFLQPLDKALINNDQEYYQNQIGHEIIIYEKEIPILENIDIVFIGISEQRGAGFKNQSNEPDIIRHALYNLYLWHQDIKLADLGNIKAGKSLNDSYAALKIVLSEIIKLNKTVVVIGGSHDVTLGQYFAYKELNKNIEVTVVDSCINLQSESMVRSANFLMQMLTEEPNYIEHYNHIGFQSYFIHPRMLEAMDKLRFDCFRVGVAKENMEEMEPIIRNSSMLSLDISAIKNCDAPANHNSPNGFTGEEACMLAKYAGMSEKVSSFGIYGYVAENDTKNITAMQIAQMIWYFLDGKSRCKQESSLNDKESFNEYHLTFSEISYTFLQSKRTDRWWMQLPDKKIIPCSKKDYLDASNNIMPERWLRAQERV